MSNFDYSPSPSEVLFMLFAFIGFVGVFWALIRIAVWLWNHVPFIWL